MSDRKPGQTGNKLKRFWGKYLFACGAIGTVAATYRMCVIHDDWTLGAFNLVLISALVQSAAINTEVRLSKDQEGDSSPKGESSE